MDFSKKLLDWYDKNKRDLPWRKIRDPYAIWVSEIMLQQTRVDSAIGYYLRFMEHFKDVQALAKASEQEVLNLWKGLGYYSRARNMHRAAKAVCEEYSGVFPKDLGALQSLPGIGRYTGAAIAGIAYNIPVPAVDGNVLRVITRYYALHDDISKNSAKTNVEERVGKLIPEERAGDFTQSLMELGALICLPQTPACGECPVQSGCMANQKGIADMLPVKAQKGKPNPVLEAWVLCIRHQDRLLMEYRRNAGLLKNLWGLPMVETGEIEDIKEYLQKEYKSGDCTEMGQVTHIFTHRTWRLRVLRAEAKEALHKEPYEWVNIKDLPSLPIPTAFKKVLEASGLE